MKKYREPLETGLKRENGWSASDARKADEARLDALRGGLTKQTACSAHFLSNKVFRGDLYIMSGEIGLYEKYGFTKPGDYETIYGSIDQLFVKPTLL